MGNLPFTQGCLLVANEALGWDHLTKNDIPGEVKPFDRNMFGSNLFRSSCQESLSLDLR